MYDPVLNRPMFQAQNTATPMAAAPMGAKGTGITSMVTSPDPDTTMQQLKSFANPAMPTVGYADGGLATQDAFNAFLNRQNGLADNAPRDEYRPTGLGGKNLVIGQPMVPDEYRPTGLGGKNLVIGQPGTPEPASQSSMRAAVSSPSPMDPRSQSPLGASSMGGGESYDIFKSGLASTQSPSNSPSSISGKGVIIQTYADGGPVQHFEGGGIASMWQNFVNSRPVKSNPYAVGIPGTSYSGNEPSDSNERDYIRDTANAEAEGEYRRAVTSSQQYIDPEEFAAAKPDMEQGYREALRQQQDVDPNAFSGAPAGIPAARPPSVRNFENPYRNDNTSDSFERAQIEKMKAPSMPPPRPTEERSSISTELNKIREDRKAQSAADRRENALMALMSAGFGMAAGKSRHALTNIAEGGQQGIATFANLERSRREDENRRYLAALHERELRMNEPYKQAMTEQAQAQAAYLKTRPASEQQRQQLRETTAMYNARKEAANEFIRRKKDDYTFGQQFNNPATGAAMEKEWLARRTRELMPEHLARVMNDANNGSQGNVSPTNAE